MLTSRKRQAGFTIVELLIVIVVIGILAAITIVAYSGIQSRARDMTRQSDIKNVQKLVEMYYAENGSYPKTADNISTLSATTVRTDSRCAVGTKEVDWVPGLNTNLPQSTPNTGKGARGQTGCYMYASDGANWYVISAWNNLESGPQTSTMYRRLGFREIHNMTGQGAYFCNQAGAIGGVLPAPYSAANDFYKHSFTLSNITNCVETPPAGA